MDLEGVLGIDPENELDSRARRLVEADRKLVRDLVARRNELGLSQAEVARRMDTAQSVVARVESGARDMHQSTIRRYAMAVEVIVEHRVVPDSRQHDRSPRIADFKAGRSADERHPFLHALDESSTSLWEKTPPKWKVERRVSHG